MSDRKRKFNFLSPIKSKFTSKRTNIVPQSSPDHNAEESRPIDQFVDNLVTKEVIASTSVTTINNKQPDLIEDFTTTINQAIKDNCLSTSPIVTGKSTDLNNINLDLQAINIHVNDMDAKNFAILLGQALSDEIVCQGFRNAMKPLTDPIEQKLDGAIIRIDTLEQTSKDTTSKLNTFDQRMDDLEQYSRKNNIRIIGLLETRPTVNNRATENTPQLVINFINDTMHLNINLQNIGNAHRLGRPHTSGRTGQECRDVIVQFTSNIVKSQIMRNRKLLKEINSNIYINDDLTKHRAQLFKEARNELQNKRLSAVWTRDGNIYVKLHEQSQPCKIDSRDGLSNFIGQ